MDKKKWLIPLVIVGVVAIIGVICVVAFDKDDKDNGGKSGITNQKDTDGIELDSKDEDADGDMGLGNTDKNNSTSDTSEPGNITGGQLQDEPLKNDELPYVPFD